MRVSTTVFLSGFLTIGGLMGVFAQELPTVFSEEEPMGVSPATEIQLRDVTPTIRDMVVQLKGTEKEEKHLKAIQNLVNKILASSKPKVVRVPVEESSVSLEEETPTLPDRKQTEKITITLSLQPVTEDTHYKLTTVLQENEEEEGISESFDYMPGQVEILQQQLEAFLFKQLNLQSTIKYVPYQQTEETIETATEVVETPKQTPLPVITQPEEEPIVTSPEEEVQLKNLTPPVKDISISLRGTEKEQPVLKTLQDMVNDIFNEARVAVVRVPTTEEPVTTPVLKVYENLEIVISAHSPSASNEPYKINIALQEKGAEEGKFKVFDYSPDKSDELHEKLRAYLFEQVPLQPK